MEIFILSALVFLTMAVGAWAVIKYLREQEDIRRREVKASCAVAEEYHKHYGINPQEGYYPLVPGRIQSQRTRTVFVEPKTVLVDDTPYIPLPTFDFPDPQPTLDPSPASSFNGFDGGDSGGGGASSSWDTPSTDSTGYSAPDTSSSYDSGCSSSSGSSDCGSSSGDSSSW